jgi:Polysaccharide deacetylase
MINDNAINRDIYVIIIIIIISITMSILTSTLEISFYPNIAYSYIFNSSNIRQQQQQNQQNFYQTNLSQIPFITTSNNKISFDNFNNNLTKAVILTFGDGYQSQYTYAKPILDKYGYKGNFFVTCNKVGLESKMTWQELAQLYNEGHVIGSKTMNYGTKAMENKDLNHLSPQELEYETGQSKQCILNHGIRTTFFAVPMNIANNNATVINTIAKYYTLAINGHSNLMFLHCDGYKNNSSQTDCRTFFDNGTLTFANRYSIGEWSEQHIKNGKSFNDTQMFDKFVTEVNSQNKFNDKGIINAIPLIAYHDIVLLPDVSYTDEPSATTLNSFDKEMKYLHDNGYKAITFDNLGYDEKNNIFYLKQN